MPVLETEIRGHVAYLTMNRPQVHNALSPELMVRLARAWRELRDDDRGARSDPDRRRRQGVLGRRRLGPADSTTQRSTLA